MNLPYKNSNCIVFQILLSQLLFLITFFLIVSQLNANYSDFVYHSKLAADFSVRNLKQEIMSGNTYFMWSMLVSVLYHFGKVSLPGACAVVTALANVLTMNVVLEYMKKRIPNIDNCMWALIGGGLMFVGPLFFPWINSYYYYGTWSPNVWHNPTNNMVRPFGLIAIILILDIIDAEEKSICKHILLSIVLGLSMIAKPSFVQGIAPAMALYVIINIIYTKKINLKKWIFLAASFIPAIFIMLFQMWLTFYSGQTKSEGIGISYLRVLKYYVGNAWVALLACMAFPLFVIIVMAVVKGKKIFANSGLILAVCYLVSSWGEMVFLYEKGERERDSNFAWGYILAVFIVWFICAMEFMKLDDQKIRYMNIVKGAGYVLFSIHLLMGVWFIINIFQHRVLF